MTISKRCIETLIDLAEIKLSCMDVTDAEDRRERELLERCIAELKAEASGANGSLLAMSGSGPKRRGRRPKHLQYHELHAA
ncbi:hypothetical protein M2352_002620 [Azospirillum fermentarium]|uniref:hypothetical protein n=1 Tax=Azospirillum fermentarium TaxID=1233114 RepID=UPI002226DD53|nr:hypothetical protein [Azospirillum fermentarium]MCW2247029.1 hypothetical protein [Azospirillum fermentarium]